MTEFDTVVAQENLLKDQWHKDLLENLVKNIRSIAEQRNWLIDDFNNKQNEYNSCKSKLNSYKSMWKDIKDKDLGRGFMGAFNGKEVDHVRGKIDWWKNHGNL